MPFKATVIKRDGRIQEFNAEKIKSAVIKTATAIKEPFGEDEWGEIKPILLNELEKLTGRDLIPISEIDDMVMETLIASRFKTIAIEYLKLRKTKMYSEANELGFSPVAMDLLNTRYLQTDKDGKPVETPREMFIRVATALASNEETSELRLKYKEEYTKILTNLEFMPNSPCLVAAGSKRRGTWLACFAYPIPDSLDGMFDLYKIMARTFKMGGGVGVSISDVREESALIATTQGRSSGPIKLVLPVIDAITEGIKQGSFRRGALMCLIQDNHPDIEAFIDAKANPGVLNNMNMSVMLTNKFMRAAEKGHDIELISPYTKKPSKTVSAKALLHKIATRIWETGEPGVLFYDRINKDNPTPHLGDLRLVNPSLAKGTKVLCTDGVFPIEELEGKNIKVATLKQQWSQAICRLSQRGASLYKIVLEGNKKYYATREHKWPALNRATGQYEKKETVNLKTGDYLPVRGMSSLPYGKEGTYNQGFLIGWNYGDGSISTRKDTGEVQYNFTISEDKQRAGCYKKLLACLKEITGSNYAPTPRNKGGKSWVEINTASGKLHQLFSVYGFLKKNEGLPHKFWYTLNEDFRKGFIDGLFSSDGCVSGELLFSSCHKKLAEDIMTYLGFYGIKSSVYFRNTKPNFPNKKDYGKLYKIYELHCATPSAVKFRSIFTLTHKDKNRKLKKLIIKRPSIRDNNIKVLDVMKVSTKSDVWDLTVNDTTHTFNLAHCVTGNCAESVLRPYEACDLGSINLVRHINGGNKLDWDKLAHTIKIALRFLDSILDKSPYPDPMVKKAVMETRKVGLGIMGFADALIMMDIKYSSHDALKFADKLMAFIRQIAEQESAKLGREKGMYEAYKEGCPKRRNSIVLTLAPTGSISLLASVSSGIEPNFASSYTRTFYPEEKTVTIEHPLKSRDCFETTYDITPEHHLKMLATFQKHVDNACSKTINVPEGTTIEDIEKLITQGWELGVKGLTIFRKNCRRKALIKCDGDVCQL